jgi:transposase
MSERRLVGIDLGIASAHTVRVLREDGSEVCRRRCWPRLDSLREVEAAALAGAPPELRLEVVIEPTGPAWLPIAVFFTGRGHTVYRVSSAQAADLRRFLSRHAKSNGIDAQTLARLPLVDPSGLRPLRLPEHDAAGLDRRVRVTDRLTRLAAEHKRRIKDLVRQLLPMTPLQGDLGKADLAVLERTGAHPRALLSMGRARLTRLIVKASKDHLGEERAQAWLDAAHLALELYGDHPATAFDDRAAEVVTEVRLLHATEAELPAHESAREHAYRQVDPDQLTRSLPGVAAVGGPALAALVGDARRFPDGASFRSFTGLAPRASETGETDRKGQPMSKAGPRLLRSTLIRAAETARHLDPQLARLYYLQVVERGACHLKALCVVAAHLSERAWAVLARGMPYELRDVDGTLVTPQEAKALAAQWKVSDEVRQRRRSRKSRKHGSGKAPHQVLQGHATRARGAHTRRPSPQPILTSDLTPIKQVLNELQERINVRP